MKNQIVLITYKSYMMEARPFNTKTLEYICHNFDCIEEATVVDFVGSDKSSGKTK